MLAGLSREEKGKLELGDASQYKYLTGVSVAQKLLRVEPKQSIIYCLSLICRAEA